ncbi:uncharacterized protein L201_004576 [Kwoniella dendrophila CBS 6074]|uniref:Vps72/YL1 C-terminal domain-containing protein n=1 Tax=Kwoniella dendrophila CBS 6074 TaxID=1295534 RepID=A0AAX4JW34_9TREE
MSSPSSSKSDDEDSRPSTPNSEDVNAYEELMTTLFPPSSLPPPPQIDNILIGDVNKTTKDEEEDNEIMENGVERPMTKAEKQNAKKKRRKERERLAKLEAEADLVKEKVAAEEDEKIKEESTVQFRLFSVCPIKPVLLIPESEEYPCPPNPRYNPISPTEQDRIRQIALEAAIESEEFSQYASSSTRQTLPFNHDLTKSLITIETQDTQNLPEILIGELPRINIVHNLAGLKSNTGHPKTSSTIPILPLKQTISNTCATKTKRKTRRGTKKKSYGYVSARFWAPSIGIGGKGRGYAWGYRDSIEGRREEGAWEGYIRSKDR